jgi:3-phosphoshikimate 1-carboxyvinyltransferase
VPGSKSLAQRVLVCAALAGGSTRVAGLPDGDDVQGALGWLLACGADVRRYGARAVTITGRPPGPARGLAPKGPVDVGESGTLARLATAALALCGSSGRSIEIRAAGSLLRRRSPPLFRALRDVDVACESLGIDDGWPVRVSPVGPPSLVTLRAPVSSQEVSALLVALAAYPDEIHVRVVGEIPSRPYLAMTAAVLRDFGVRLETRPFSDGEEWSIRGPLVPPSPPITIESDASSAAVALAAACISGGRLRVGGIPLDSRQGDVRIVEHLRPFGCRAGRDDRGLWAEGFPTRGARIDLTGEPDLAPVLAAVGAACAIRGGDGGEIVTLLTGLETLPGKESSRIAVLAEGLSAVGASVQATDRALEIRASGVRARGETTLDPRGDHRMAFAFALIGLAVDGVRVRDPQCVGKSWPGFWRDLERIGARVVPHCGSDLQG